MKKSMEIEIPQIRGKIRVTPIGEIGIIRGERAVYWDLRDTGFVLNAILNAEIKAKEKLKGMG
jgi:hypothetical protein